MFAFLVALTNYYRHTTSATAAEFEEQIPSGFIVQLPNAMKLIVPCLPNSIHFIEFDP